MEQYGMPLFILLLNIGIPPYHITHIFAYYMYGLGIKHSYKLTDTETLRVSQWQEQNQV